MGDFAAELNRILQEYGDEVYKEMDSVINGVAKAAANKVRAASPKKGGEYASGWRSKVEKGRLSVKGIIYNAKKPGLPHLLEHGHAHYVPGKGGHYIAHGRVGGRAHIQPAEEWASDEVIKRLEARLGR